MIYTVWLEIISSIDPRLCKRTPMTFDTADAVRKATDIWSKIGGGGGRKEGIKNLPRKTNASPPRHAHTAPGRVASSHRGPPRLLYRHQPRTREETIEITISASTVHVHLLRLFALICVSPRCSSRASTARSHHVEDYTTGTDIVLDGTKPQVM